MRRFQKLGDKFLDGLSDKYEALAREENRILEAKGKVAEAYWDAAQGRTINGATFAPKYFAGTRTDGQP